MMTEIVAPCQNQKTPLMPVSLPQSTKSETASMSTIRNVDACCFCDRQIHGFEEPLLSASSKVFGIGLYEGPRRGHYLTCSRPDPYPLGFIRIQNDVFSTRVDELWCWY